MNLKNDSRTHGLSLSFIDCQACVLRPGCESTIYINQGDLVLTPGVDACKTTPEPYIDTLNLVPPLYQFFQNVPIDKLNFPSYSVGEARKSIPESVQLELTEFPDVRRVDLETLQKLTEPIVAQYTSLNAATVAAFDNCVAAKTSLFISRGSTLVSILCFYLIFQFFSDKLGHFVAPHVISSRKNLANLFMSRTTSNQTPVVEVGADQTGGGGVDDPMY